MKRSREANQSNVAINLREHQSIIFEQHETPSNQYQQELDPHNTPIITENVPFTNQINKISPYYIAFNLIFNLLLIGLIIVFIMVTEQNIPKYFFIAITTIFYCIYLIVAYKFSTLLFLTDLRSLHEYKLIFENLVNAECRVEFTYIPPRNMIDEKEMVYKVEYQHVMIKDKSGQLYNIQKSYDVACIKYNKKYYYCDSLFKGKVYLDFNDFIKKSSKEHDKKHTKRLLRSREKIEFIIDGLKSQIGFYIQQSNCYKCWFMLTFVLGFGIYYELYMKKKVLRYEMDIVKEICPKYVK